MSIIPYNNNKDVLYHNPNDGIVVVHDPRENTIKLLSTVASEARENQMGVNEQGDHHRPLTMINSPYHKHDKMSQLWVYMERIQ